MTDKSDKPGEDDSEQAPSAGWRETAEAMHVDAEPNYEDLSNEELLELVADLDDEQYPIASRARKALSQLEGSSA